MLRDRLPAGPEVDEMVFDNEAPLDYVSRVTHDKASFGQKTMLWRKLPLRPVLAADTAVVLNGRILGKPATVADAIAGLTALSGRTHEVHTSVVVRHREEIWQLTQTSEVTFASLSTQQIATYCATSEPYDKAGGYAVQGLAALFITNIRGSYSGIMGLPLFETAQLLQQVGLKLL